MMAIAALSACKKLNIKVPEKLSIVGYDDIEISAYVNPSLATVVNPKYEIGNRIAEVLIDRIERIEKKDGDYIKEVMNTSLLIRDSCKSIN